MLQPLDVGCLGPFQKYHKISRVCEKATPNLPPTSCTTAKAGPSNISGANLQSDSDMKANESEKYCFV